MRCATSRKHFSRTLFSASVLLLSMTIAACSGSGGEALVETSPAPAVEASASATQSYEVPAGLEMAGKDNDGEGEYSRVSLAEGSPLYTYDPAVVSPEIASAFSSQDIVEAQRIAADFAVEEGVDSILVDSSRVDEWYAQNASKFDETSISDVEEALTVRESGQVLNGLVANDVLGGRGYDLATDGGPRISALNIAISSVFSAPNGDLAFEFTGSATRRALGQGDEVMDFKQAYALVKGNDGQWRISGWNNTFTYL